MIKSKEGLLVRKFGEKYIIVAIDDMADELHSLITLNETGLFLWNMIEKGTDYDSMLLTMLETYEVDRATAEADIKAFVEKAIEAGLIDA